MRNFLPGESIVVLDEQNELRAAGDFVGYADEFTKIVYHPDGAPDDEMAYAARSRVMLKIVYDGA